MQAIDFETNLTARAEQTTKRLNALAAKHGLLLTDSNWNEVINILDSLNPLWRGYPVPQTTGTNWRMGKGSDVEVIG